MNIKSTIAAATVAVAAGVGAFFALGVGGGVSLDSLAVTWAGKPSNLDVTSGPGTVSCAMTLTGTAVIDAVCALSSPSGEQKRSCYANSNIANVWSCNVSIPEDSEAGAWKVAYVSARTTLTSKFLATGADIIAAGDVLKDGGGFITTAADLEIPLTSATPDSTAPTINTFTILPAGVEQGQVATCTIGATDGTGSGVERVGCTLSHPVDTRKLSCVSEAGSSSCVIQIPANAELGTWSVTHHFARDYLLNLTRIADGGSISVSSPTLVGQIIVDVTPDSGPTYTITGPSYPTGQTFGGDQTLPGLSIGPYTIVYNDTLIGNNKPADDNVVLDALGHTFLATYTARSASTISVDVGLNDSTPPLTGAPPLGGAWDVTATGFGIVDSGTGDKASVSNVYNGREYSISFTGETDHTTPTPGPITASGTPQTFLGNYVFTGGALASAGLHAVGSTLLDACNDPVRLVGVNHHGFIGSFSQPEYGAGGASGSGNLNYDLQGTAFAEIAKTGANAVKIAWGTPEAAFNNSDPCYNHPNDGTVTAFCNGHNEQGDFPGGAFQLTGPGSLDTQVQAAIDAGLFPIVAMYDPIGPGNWGDPTGRTPFVRTMTFSATVDPQVRLVTSGLPTTLAVNDVINVTNHDAAGGEHNGLYKIVEVTTPGSSYLLKNISGATTSAAAESASINIPDGNFEHMVLWLESQPVRDWVNGIDANGHNRSEYLIMNIGAEAGPALGPPYTEYITAYEWAIKRLRLCNNPATDPCYTVPLLIDADDYASDEASVSLTAGAPTWIAADPLDNIILDWHHYIGDTTDAPIIAAMDTLQTAGLPVAVAEFGGSEVIQVTSYPTMCLNPIVRTRTITREAEARGFHIMPWAWGDDAATGLANHYWNNDFDLGCWELDMSDFETCASLERWGCDTVKTDPHGVANTAARSQYLIDRCGTETARPAPGACGDSCSLDSGFDCSAARATAVSDYSTSSWYSSPVQDTAPTTLNFSTWVWPNDITNPDQGVWVGPSNGGNAPVYFQETSMRVSFTGAAGVTTVAALDGTGVLGTADDDTYHCEDGVGPITCPTVNQRAWHRVDFVANLATNTYDAFLVDTCDPVGTPQQIANDFAFATDSIAVNQPASLDYYGVWGAYRSCTGGTNDGLSCMTAAQCPGGACGTATGTIRMKYPSWVAECTPDCGGKVCGPDSCGGTCPPGCSGGQICDPAGLCQDPGTYSVSVTSPLPTAGCNGVAWEVRDPANNLIDSGTGNRAPTPVSPGNYKVTWLDTAYACSTPVLDGGTSSETLAVTNGGAVTFDLSTNYSLRTTAQLEVDVQKDTINDCTDCGWNIEPSGTVFTPSDFYASGTADAVNVSGTGTIYNGRNYDVTWVAQSGFTITSTNPTVLTANTASKQKATGNWNTVAGVVFWSDTLQSQAAPSNFMEWISERPYDANLQTNDFAGANYGNTRIVDPFGSGDWVAYGYANFTTIGGNRIELGVCGYSACQDTGGNSLPAFNAHLKSGNTTSPTAHAKFYISHETYIPTQIYTQAGTQVNQWLSILDLHTCATSGTGFSCENDTWGGGWGWMVLGDGGPGYDPGRLFMRPNNAPGTDSGLSTADYPANQWFCLEFEVPVTQSTVGAIKTYINGNLVLTKNNAQTFPAGGVPEDVGIYFKIYGDDQGSSDILPNPVQLYRKNFKISSYKTDCQ